MIKIVAYEVRAHGCYDLGTTGSFRRDKHKF